MTHLRPEDRSTKQGKTLCRKGRHPYGEPQNIGAGMTRRVCENCGEVTIDLTGVSTVTEPVLKPKTGVVPLTASDS